MRHTIIPHWGTNLFARICLSKDFQSRRAHLGQTRHCTGEGISRPASGGRPNALKRSATILLPNDLVLADIRARRPILRLTTAAGSGGASLLRVIGCSA